MEEAKRLDATAGYKPLDFGAGGVTGSVDSSGRLIAVNGYHPQYGYVTLTTAPPFAETERYNAAAVRAYRRSLAALAGFGLAFEAPIVQTEAFLLEDAIPALRLTLSNGISAEVVTFVPADLPLGVVQSWRFAEKGQKFHFSGKVWLTRCAYTQLTEGGVAPMPAPQTEIAYQRPSGIIELENPALDWRANLNIMGAAAQDDGSVLLDGARLPFVGEDGLHYLVTLGNDKLSVIQLGQLMADSADLLPRTLQKWRERWRGVPPDRLLRRGLVYGLGCCVPLPDGAVCILTDHMLLPLSWNRDAYYIARALANWLPEGKSIMGGHLQWMFRTAERLDGFWGRSYLANGRVKDRGFQLDQQLFPLLELAEYMLEGGEGLEDLYAQVDPLLDALLARRNPQGLFPTDETPADDPIPYPYPLASHILLWHTLNTLARLQAPSRHDFAGLAAAVRESIWAYFVGQKDGVRLFAYATDGQGKHHFYHDANDIPLAFAPAWGFVEASDPVWQATVDFAFSAANVGGFYDGGLGSVHTPAPWALGDIQNIIMARALGDPTRAAHARARLQKAAQWDGALPEAYDAQTFAVVSRHWFAWTNAMLGCIDRKTDIGEG